MKFNINLDWAVITSIFTLFLFWCGYWYWSGYASFYNYPLDVFDLPLSSLIMAGITIGIYYVIILMSILITLSFLLSVDKRHWNYLLGRFVYFLFNICFLFYHLYRHFVKPSASSILKNCGIKILTIIKPYVRSIVRLDALIGRKAERSLKMYRLSSEELKKEIYGSDTPKPSISFEASLVIHYLAILILVVGLMYFFKIAINQNEVGYKKAQETFQSYSNLPKVEIPNNESKDLANTGLCFKGSCLITDSKKTVHLQEMKDVKVLNKKAP